MVKQKRELLVNVVLKEKAVWKATLAFLDQEAWLEQLDLKENVESAEWKDQLVCEKSSDVTTETITFVSFQVPKVHKETVDHLE